MSKIDKFIQVRRDGKVIEESMTAQDIAEANWPPEKIESVQWYDESQLYTIKSTFGLLAKLTPDRNFIAVLDDVGLDAEITQLNIYNSMALKSEVPSDYLFVNGKYEQIRFRWFEPADSVIGSAFGVVFEVLRTNGMWQADIDARTAQIIKVRQSY